RVGLLAVVDRQGEEVEPLAARRGDDGDQRQGVADADDHGAAGLLGEMTGLDAQELATDGALHELTGKHVAGHGPYLGEMVLDEHPVEEALGVDWLDQEGAGFGRGASSLEGTGLPWPGTDRGGPSPAALCGVAEPQSGRGPDADHRPDPASRPSL